MGPLLRTNPGLLVWLILFAIGGGVCLVLGRMMGRSGASLRPLWWFAGFILLIGLPQFAAHLGIALATLRREAPRIEALHRLAAENDRSLRTADARRLFGSDADPDLITDARPVVGEAFAAASAAQFATLPGGETVLLAQFDGHAAAERAWVDYLQITGLAQLGGVGDSQRGYAVNRPAGGRAFVLHDGNFVSVWTGADDGVIRARMNAAGFRVPRRAPLEGNPTPAIPPEPGPGSGLPWPIVATLFASYLLLVVAYFFRGAAWAGSLPAKTSATRSGAYELADRLLSINALDVPYRIERGGDGKGLIATWRHTDAKWADLARIRGVQGTFRIHMNLDESSRVVRATDSAARVAWSAGADGASAEWKTSRGIVFFQRERQHACGLVLNERGEFRPAVHEHSFRLEELKSPLIAAVHASGWTWRPTVWQGPAWLRWLTG